MPTVFLVVSVIGVLFTLNAFRPPRRPEILSVAVFFAGWLTSELPVHHIVWQFVATVIFAGLGVVVFVIAFSLVVRLAPLNLWKEIGQERNIAAAILAGAVALGLCWIIAATMH